MATVFLARDEELDRLVAVKLLADNLAGDDTFRERFVREARLAAGLAHPNIVTVFDAGEEDGRPYIVMEYVEGETLADGRRRGRYAPDRAVDLGLQACAGLEHAHASGLVHRDVKPQNLLIRSDGALKIADFGIARAAGPSQLTELGTVLGTAAYLSPEQAAGEPVTAAADIYSLGAVLYELLTGRTPFAFDSVVELVRKQQEEPITPVRDLAPDVPSALEEAVMRALARLPEYRPASAAEFARALAAASPEPPTMPLPTPTGVRATEVETMRLGRTTRSIALHRRHLILAAVVATLALLVVLGLALRPDGNEGSPQQVTPVPRGDTPEEKARNLSDWLRRNAGG